MAVLADGGVVYMRAYFNDLKMTWCSLLIVVSVAYLKKLYISIV
jgi:hypothetical protein